MNANYINAVTGNKVKTRYTVTKIMSIVSDITSYIIVLAVLGIMRYLCNALRKLLLLW